MYLYMWVYVFCSCFVVGVFKVAIFCWDITALSFEAFCKWNYIIWVPLFCVETVTPLLRNVNFWFDLISKVKTFPKILVLFVEMNAW